MICSSGISFDPRLDGRRLLFGFDGIWQGTSLLYDRGTGSRWMHFTGECVDGPLAGRRLRALPAGRHTTWGAWRREQPATDLMAPDERFAARYFPRAQCRSGQAHFPPEFPRTIQSRDPRLAPADLLLGVRVAGAARAYPLQRLARGPGVVEETVAGVPLTVWYDPEQRAAQAFDARLDGTPRSFARREGRFVDTATGSVFDLEGACGDGPLRGRRLDRPVTMLSEWYGWYAHHPDTTVWEGP